MNARLVNLVVTLILSVTLIFFGTVRHDGAQAGPVTELGQHHDAKAPMHSDGPHEKGAVLCDAIAGHCASVLALNQGAFDVLVFGSSNIRPTLPVEADFGRHPETDTPPPRI